jgi:hypothetical protein
MLISAFICVYLRFWTAGATILAETSARNIDAILAGGGAFASGGCVGLMSRTENFIFKII